MVTRAERATATANRAMVRDVSGRTARADIAFDARTAYDFVVSLYIGAGDESDLLPQDRAWLERVTTDLPAQDRSRMNDCFGESSAAIFRGLPALMVNNPELKTAAQLVDSVKTQSDDELSRLFVDDMVSPYGRPELTERLLAGDTDALAEAAELLDDYHQPALEDLLSDPPARLAEMRKVLDAWLPRYQEIEPRIAQMLQRDLSRRAKNDQADVVALIEDTTGGLRWFPEAGVRRVIMAPMYFGRPYNYIYKGSDWRLFLYPLAEEALGPTDASVPSESVVRLYRALGDATRMRVLRLLSERDWYLTELAQQLELSKPTMKHHLALLRAAGLVTVTDEGSMTYYSLRRERIREAGLELERFLG